MEFALSTHWNAGRHTSGEAMIAEIQALGIHRVELGYDLRLDLVEGVRRLVTQGAVKVTSVHNYCPVPVGAPRGHPELFDLSSLDRRTRASAVDHTGRTIQFAAEVGAECVVAHAGNVEMKHYSRTLIELAREGRLFDKKYEKVKDKLLVKRSKYAAKHLEALGRSIAELMPVLDSAGVRICFENLPSWEAIPTESELETLLSGLQSPRVGYWHDFGHAQIRQNMGFSNHLHWLKRLKPWLGGTHIHDVAEPVYDHLMPPAGTIDFTLFRELVQDVPRLVLEPMPGTPPERIIEGLAALRAAWEPAGDAPPQIVGGAS